MRYILPLLLLATAAHGLDAAGLDTKRRQILLELYNRDLSAAATPEQRRTVINKYNKLISGSGKSGAAMPGLSPEQRWAIGSQPFRQAPDEDPYNLGGQGGMGSYDSTYAPALDYFAVEAFPGDVTPPDAGKYDGF